MLKPIHPSFNYVPQEDPEDIPFTKMMRNIVTRVAPVSLKSSVVVILCWTEMTVGIATMELGFLKLKKMIQFSTARVMY